MSFRLGQLLASILPYVVLALVGIRVAKVVVHAARVNVLVYVDLLLFLANVIASPQ